jgi:predicted Zn-dependent peptidase
MRLPIIKHLVQFIEDNDSDYIEETISVLEDLTENPNIKDEEIDVIGELLSNLYGAVE